MNKAPVQPNPEDGIIAINYSRRCLAFSFGGLVPLLGLPFVLLAFANYYRARAASNGYWNAGQTLLVWGRVIATLGLLITLLALILSVCAEFQLLPWQYQPPSLMNRD